MFEYAPGWQDHFSWVIYVGFVVAFLVAFGMGANDCANSYGTVVGAGVLKLWQAYILATVFETLGAGLLGYKVTDTMRKQIVNVSIYDVYSEKDENGTYQLMEYCNSSRRANASDYDCTDYTSAEFMLGELGALIGTAFWLILATIVHLPVSTTHSAVGATLGFSVVLKGPDGINWWKVINIVVSWIASPALAGFASVSFYLIIKYSVFKREHPFDASLQMLPVFYFFALTVNSFSILFEGSKYLKFDKLTWWVDLLISLFIGTSVALITYFWGKEIIKQRILKKSIPVKFSSKCESRVDDCESRIAETPAPVAQPKITVTNENDAAQIAGSSEKEKDKSKPNVYINGDSGFELTPTRMSTKFVTSKKPLFTSVATSQQSLSLIKHSSRNTSASALTRLNDDTPMNTPAVPRNSTMVDPKSLKEKLKALKHPVEEHPLASQVFNYLQILSACFLSFSHGSNDTANAVGPLVGLWLAYYNGNALKDAGDDMIMLYLILFGALSMIVGLWVLGHKVISTIGTKITLVTPPSGFAMELGTAFTVLVASKIGIPISTTHCMVGAVVCVGWVKSHEGGVSWKVFRNIAIAWVVTLPVASAVAGLAAYLLKLFVL